MKCTKCESGTLQFLGVWYIDKNEFYVLQNVYGCDKCKILTTRPVGESDFYYVQKDGSIIVRPHHLVVANERRINIVDYDPTFNVSK